MFPQKYRLKSGFSRILTEGKKIKTEHFLFFYSNSNNAHSRVGIIVTKKIGNAVVRNNVKRRFRSIFLEHPYILGKGFDIIIIPSKFVDNWKNVSYKILVDELLYITQKL